MPGSGLRKITIDLLAAHGIDTRNTTLTAMISREADMLLRSGDNRIFSACNEFPGQHTDNLPISGETRRDFRSGRPFLQNYLPFWLANFIEQRFVIVVPLLAMLLALLQTVPLILVFRVCALVPLVPRTQRTRRCIAHDTGPDHGTARTLA
ncbi:putative TRAP-type uncharacterized transport system periplasmic ligand binding protein [Oxalobacteraceae bacterium IMCC9480]|nr:putative TRAP-type uncharacterized transport system periplasmic ligand binding protein [Oxalobacteraceae bacterium IMCC9480]